MWEHAIGVRYPADARASPSRSPTRVTARCRPPWSTARDRYRAALEAAVRHAAAQAAVRVVEAQEAATRRRLRAIEHRWLPRLEESLARVQLQLEENEHADGVLLRWASGPRGTRPQEEP